MRAEIVVMGLFGPPLSGKGTIARELSCLNIPHISTGDLLRAAIKDGRIGSEAARLIEKGALVPDGVMLSLLKARLAEKDCENGFVLDGFPRIISQTSVLDELGTRFTHIVEIKASTELILKRQQVRAAEQGRKDDTESVVRRRVNDYYFNTVPVLEHYKPQLGIKYIQVSSDANGSKENAQIILDEINKSIQKLRSRL